MIKNKKIYAFVPARGGSKGIKLKNLKKIKNKSLIKITSDFIDSIPQINQKYLSSENVTILNEAKKNNFNLIKRTKKLSGDKISDIQLLLDFIKKLNNNLPDYIIYLQPTSPIRKKSHLLKALNTVIRKNLDGAWSVSQIDIKYHPLKVLKKSDDLLFSYIEDGKKIVARQMLDDIYIRNGVFYIFSVKSLLKQKSIFLKKTYASLTNYRSINIDNMNDLKIARRMFR